MAKTFENSQGQTYTTQQEAAASNTALGTNPQTISSAQLQPTAEYKMPAADTTTTTSNLALSNNAAAANVATEATYAPPVNPAKDDLRSALSSLMGDAGNQSSAENQIRQEQQVYEKKKKATEVSNQLDQMDKAYRDEVKALKENPQGKFGGAVQADVNAATDRYENNRANVALTYKVLAGDYNDAQQIVQDKISSLQAQNAQKIQLYQLAAGAVQNDLTESEKLIVQANLTRKNDEAKLLQTAYASTLSNASVNGAPASVLSAIDAASRAPGATAASVITAAGQYGVDRSAQLKLQEQEANIRQSNAAAAASGRSNNNSDPGPVVTPEQANDPFVQKLLASNGGKAVTGTPLDRIEKARTVLGQLGSLQASIQQTNTGPIVGAFKGANPWDTNAQVIKGKLNAIIPNLARGIYGEVGVLTDNDINNYKGTLGNLTSTEDVNNALLYITLDLVGKSIKNTLEVQAAGGRDVSGFADIYTDMEATKSSLLSQFPQNVEITPDDEALFSSTVGNATSGGGFWSSFLSGLSGN